MLRKKLETSILWVSGTKSSGQSGMGRSRSSGPGAQCLPGFLHGAGGAGGSGFWQAVFLEVGGGCSVWEKKNEGCQLLGVCGKLAGRTNRSLCELMKTGK